MSKKSRRKKKKKAADLVSKYHDILVKFGLDSTEDLTFLRKHYKKRRFMEVVPAMRLIRKVHPLGDDK